MDPVILGLMFSGLCAAIPSFYLGRRKGQRDIDPENLAKELKRKTFESESLSKAVLMQGKDIKRLEKQRDQYRTIATSHEWSDDPDPVERQIWKGRRYSDHPEANLKNMVRDLKALKGKHIRVRMIAIPLGGWTKIFETLKFDWREGSPDRVIEELTTVIRDDDGMFIHDEIYRKGYEKFRRKAWRDKDSPVRFVVDLWVVEHGSPEQVMEVAVVEEVIVERIVEKNVFLESDHVPCDHSVDELSALLEVAEQEDLITRHRRSIERAKRASQEQI